ncbi:DUF998 domain-containing protein [Williamsia phyllosphaerae]|uniref:DUF998 domain-containing protein n=1 Tax=Williamsia phyllosphaerae TaxID=885042 RepID=A0ABQ1UBR1_9NOCA|nr:DUF998 domain-containing protein [Williamsia phyllosphaerae]GGF12347.1 hypothetical protein GCM10007298_05350 [Williamsia phyllosphaerae]
MTHRPSGVRLAAWAWLIGGLVYFVTEALAAVRYPDYSYARDYISALGVPDASPSAALMNLGAFIVHGILFAAGGLLLVHAIGRTSRGRTAFVMLTVINGVGNVLVGVFHAGASPLHGFGALLAIVGGNAAMIVAGGVFADIGAPRWYCVASRVAGVLGIASFVALLAIAGADTGLEGAVERGAVYSIIGWDIVTGLVILLPTLPGRRAAPSPPRG